MIMIETDRKLLFEKLDQSNMEKSILSISSDDSQSSEPSNDPSFKDEMESYAKEQLQKLNLRT